MSTLERDELIAEVSRNLAARGNAHAFTPALEDHYRTSIARQRRRSVMAAALIGLMVLCAFVVHRTFFTDTTSDPIAFRRWLFTMAAIVAVAAATLAGAAVSRSHRGIDRSTIFGVIAIAALVTVSFRVETGDAATIGIYCWVMVPLAATNLTSLHFRQALVSVVSADAIYAAGLVTIPDLDPFVHVPALLLTISVSVMTLWGSYRNDRDHRALFLYMTRERLSAERSAEQNAALREMTTLDPLTGIPNRRAFEARLAEIRADAGVVALAMVDIDHFKAFNDLYGHPEGDRCLTAVARALTSAMRGRRDLVARLGGEEFVVLAALATPTDAPALLERLRRAVEKLAIPHATAGRAARPVVTVSLGCAVFTAMEASSQREAMERADRALYASKRGGRNRWTIYDAALASHGEAGLAREVDEVGL
ncbi:MAG: GGDEF domain-containing protein [Hyphomicrobiales bacterium]|nr:GGDEF domain-containing protein [Hyphomicrobiales bacterium]